MLNAQRLRDRLSAANACFATFLGVSPLQRNVLLVSAKSWHTGVVCASSVRMMSGRTRIKGLNYPIDVDLLGTSAPHSVRMAQSALAPTQVELLR